jgi:DNA replication and repair protein RecF
VLVRRLVVTDFRNYQAATLELAPGLNVVVGDNGQGKTNLVEALGYLATLDSFRGAPDDALVREGTDAAVVRADVVHTDGREVLIEAEILRTGRNRVLVNKQRLQRARDLLGVVRVTVFSPDDLVLLKGGPADRRRYLDDTLVALSPRYDVARSELERILRQRNALLKQAGGRLAAEIELTLDVWDAKLSEVGERVGRARAAVVAELEPLVSKAYGELVRAPAAVVVTYDPAWRASGLAAALAEGRAGDVRRQVSLVGPHRDEVAVLLNGLPARTHASQGEQRSLALALRLAAHELVRSRTGDTPVLLLDDVFSELDPERSQALLDHLPAGQVLLTTAGVLPPGARPERTLRISEGRLVA